MTLPGNQPSGPDAASELLFCVIFLKNMRRVFVYRIKKGKLFFLSISNDSDQVLIEQPMTALFVYSMK